MHHLHPCSHGHSAPGPLVPALRRQSWKANGQPFWPRYCWGFPWGECSWDKDLQALISIVCAVPIYPPIFSTHLTFLILSILLLFFRPSLNRVELLVVSSQTLLHVYLSGFSFHAKWATKCIFLHLSPLQEFLLPPSIRTTLRGYNGTSVYFCLKQHVTLSHLWTRCRLFLLSVGHGVSPFRPQVWTDGGTPMQ